MADDTIDNLLERYLGLVDEYTKLRAALTDLQAGLYQDIARANFAAERGIRYGQDFYDDRMQSLRRLLITQESDADDDAGYAGFKVVARVSTDSGEGQGPESHGTGTDPGDDQGDEKPEAEAAEAAQPAAAASTQKQRDPLRWFGLLAPMPLRQAQARAVQAVEQMIPRLASIDAEMAAVEIQVRRARKRRAKAEAAVAKERRASEGAGNQSVPEVAV